LAFKLPENKAEAFDMAELAVDGLNAIAMAAGGATAATAGGVLTVVRVILATLEERRWRTSSRGTRVDNLR
jgi:hypothetical protein